MTPLPYDDYRARERFPALDGLRAISVLLVITCHMSPHPVWRTLNGELGVQIFFVLSGYLITTLALREESRNGRLGLRAFFVRRSFRIMPLYYLVLATYVVLLIGAGLWDDKRDYSLRNLAAYLLYFQEVPFYDQPGRMIFAHSWSLGIEEKFYLLWPLFAFALGATRPRLRATATVLTIALFAVAPKLTWVYAPHWVWVGHCLFSYQTILVGCLLAFLLHDREWYDRVRWLGTTRGLYASGVVLVSTHLGLVSVERLRYLYPLATAAVIASLVVRPGTPLLSAKPVVLIGTLSYGMYLIHWLCVALTEHLFPNRHGELGMAALTFIVAAASSAAVAYALHRAVEKPLIAVGRRIAAKLTPRTESPLRTSEERPPRADPTLVRSRG